MAKYTTNQIIREVQREIEQRKRVYGRMVETGALTRDHADYRIGIMQQSPRTIRQRRGSSTHDRSIDHPPRRARIVGSHPSRRIR